MSDTTKDEELFGPAEAAEAPAAPEPQAEPEAQAPEPAAAPAAPEPEAEADEEEAPPAGAITPAAVAAMRRDWKAKSIRAEEQANAARAEAERLRLELEALRKAPPPAPPQAAAPQRMEIGPDAPPAVIARNMQLETFEEIARETHGAAVDEALAAFETEARANPVLDAAIRSARNPWSELIRWHARHKAMSEIGPDPNGWRERERERLRAELATEMQAAAVPAKPAAPQVPRSAPSLANATAVAGRDAAAYSGPTPMLDILPNDRAFGGR